MAPALMVTNIRKYLFEKRFHFNRFEFNLLGLFFITVGVVAGSYLTLTKFTKIFAANDTHQIWTFNLANVNQFTAATNLVVVDDTGAHPTGGTVGANKLSNSDFATNTTSWSVSAVPPSGWVEVPGNATFYTGNYTGNFLAMKYEAKCANVSTPTVGLTSPADATYEVYNDAGAVTPANNCTDGGSPDNNRVVASLASGYPIAYINQTESAARCTATTLNGNATHLMLDPEWMTIARDAELQNSNWSLGTVGSGYLYAGHNDNSPAKARVASTNDANRAAYTDAGGTTEALTTATNTASGQSGTVGNQVRTFNLSNGSVIWDIPGNLWEWTNKTQVSTIDTTAEWVEWNHANVAAGARALYGSNTYLSNQGTGQVYGGALTNGFRRGGGWGDTSVTGAFTLLLDNAPGNRSVYVGFRCASDPVAISQSFLSNSGRAASGGNTITIGSVSDGKVIQSVNVGNTSTYDFSAYVYDSTAGNVGGTVTSLIAQLYYGGNTITNPQYTAVVGETGWWKLTGTVTGVNAAVDTGLIVKAGKTVIIDDFTLSKQGTYSVYTTAAYSNGQMSSWDSFAASVTATGNASVVYQICTDDGSTCQTGNSWQYWTGSTWASATDTTTTVNTAAQLTPTAMAALSTASKKISVKAILGFGGTNVPYINTITIGLTTDTIPPTNATTILMNQPDGSTCTNADNCFSKQSNPTFSWTAGSDTGGSNLRGYCIYFGTDVAGNPASSKGKLGTTPVSIPDGSNCQFIVSSTSLNLGTSGYLASALSMTDTFAELTPYTYFLNIKAVDNAGNSSASSVSLKFRYDGSGPTNVTYISPASGSFSNVADMSFSWPISGGAAASEPVSESGLLGYQYQINSTSGTWKGTTTSSSLSLDYIPAATSTYTLRSGIDSVNSGTNVIYFRSVDNVGNFSSDATIRTGNLSYGGEAPAFDGLATVTITPSSSDTNSYALSWPVATATNGKTVTHYYYMINTSPPSTLSTLQGNSTTYIDNGTATTVAAAGLPNVNKGTNTVYVVAIDNASTPNYSPSNSISGTFTLNSTTPDNVGNLVASDSSIKSQSQWNVTLTWTAPLYQGAGNLTYLVYRSADGTTFAQVGSSSGLSYVDSAPLSALYYYKVYTKDGANSTSSGTNAVSITPTGKWTTAPTLTDGPDVGSITTKKATITWDTSRSSDSKVAFGTSSGDYNDEEPSNSSQVSSHTINLTGLKPGTKYYYKAKWTDEDGNTGTSDEEYFTTADAPTVKDVSAKNIGLTSAIIQFTSKDASKVKIYYGKSTSFGGVKEISTSTTETTYTAELSGLDDGVKYYYKINTYDSESSEYEGTILDFTTLPRPRISNVALQEVAGTAQTTIYVTWTTNTEISSIVTYYPVDNSSAARDEVSVALIKGEHKTMLRGLLPNTSYLLIVKGRDKIGNEAVSDSQRFTTSTDTRPPQIMDLHVEGATIPPVAGTAQESTAQLIVTWNTDEPASSQVEFGEGTGNTYAQKTQEDSNLTYNHLVIISNMTPAKVYHLRSQSSDKAGNLGESVDTVTITPKQTDNALNLVITNLQQVFGFLGGNK